jgi:hypothetical protein
MYRLTVDFNALPSGLVRGLAPDGADLRVELLVVLVDGEGNEAIGILRELRDGLAFAEVDWETFGPEGRFQIVDLGLPEAPQETMYAIGEAVWHSDGAKESVTPKVAAAEHAMVAA